jgi:hypothetical protein
VTRRLLAFAGVLLFAVAAVAGFLVTRPDGEFTRVAVPALLPEGQLTIGVQDDQIPVADPATVEDRMDILASTGVKVTRVDVLWIDVAPMKPANGRDPNDPAYNWERYDTIVDGFDRRGIQVLFSVYRTPGWANGGQSFQYAPTDLDAYGDFMSALATRYDGRTLDSSGRTHARVQIFEPWNEPNIPLFVLPQWETVDGEARPASPRIYAELLAHAYPAIHDAQEDAVVIGPAGGPTGKDKPPEGSVGILTFINELAALDPKLDALSQHIYPAPAPTAETTAIPSYATLPRLVAELDRLAPDTPILITEMGYTTAKTPYRATAVTEEQQAEYLPQALEILAREPRIRLAVWFNMQDNPDWPGGLLRFDETRSRKPSWDVFVDTPKTRPSGSVD